MILGTRGSELARAQARVAREALARSHPGEPMEERIVRTSGDAHPEQAIAEFSARGIFVREIDELVLAGDVDLAVHSLKDIPTELPRGLEIAAVLPRSGGVDVILGEGGLSGLRRGARIGTSSLRRRAQLLRHRQDLMPMEIRGNVTTRLTKWRDGAFDALVLSRAGLDHLGLDVPMEELDPREFVPAPGQGVIAMTARVGSRAAKLASALDHGPTRREVEFERAILGALGGGCAVPIAARATSQGDGLEVHVEILSTDGRRSIGVVRRVADRQGQREARALAKELLAMGGGDLLGEAQG